MHSPKNQSKNRHSTAFSIIYLVFCVFFRLVSSLRLIRLNFTDASSLSTLTHSLRLSVERLMCVCMFWVPTTNTIALFIYFESERCNPYNVSTHVDVHVSSFLSVIMRIQTKSHFYHFEELWKRVHVLVLSKWIKKKRTNRISKTQVSN